MRLAVLIGVILSGAMQIQLPGSATPTVSHSLNTIIRSQRSAAVRQQHTCPQLEPGETTTTTVSMAHRACFSIEIERGEAQRLTVTQPEDLEIHVRAKNFVRLVDGFDMGNETVTLQNPGSYRIEVSEVKPARGVLKISASIEPLSPEQAVAWEEVEKWATMSKRSKKMESINKSLDLWSRLGDTDSVARTYLKRESVLRPADAVAARTDAEKALDLCGAISDVRCSAEAANNSAVSSRTLGDVDRAVERYREAAEDWQKLHDSHNAAVTRSNLGVLLWQSGDYERALRELTLAGLALRGNEAGGYASVLNSLGLYYQSLAEYDKARGYFEKAIGGFVREKKPKDLLRARLNLGRNYMLEGRFAQARSRLEHVLKDAMEASDRMATADALRNLGQTLWRQNHTEQARANFEKAVSIDRSVGYLRGQSSALHYLGLTAQKNGDVADARALLHQALQIRRAVGLRDDAAESLLAVANLEYEAGNLPAARQFSEQALKELELVRSQVPGPALRASYYSRKRQFFDLLVEIALALKTPTAEADALLAVERGRARSLMDLLSGGSLLGQIPPDLVEKRESIQRQLDFLSGIKTDKNGEVRRRINGLVAEAEEVEDRIREFIVGEKLCPALESIGELQQSLPADSAILEYNLGNQHSYLWLVEAQKIRLFRLPPASKIEAIARPVIQGFGQILDRRRSPEKQAAFNRAMGRLSRMLLSELSSTQLPQRLILVPDSVLYRVPFAALKIPHGPAPLGLSHDLVQIPSAAYLTLGKHPRPISEFPQVILAMVDPVFSHNDPRIPSRHRRSSPADPALELVRLLFTAEINTIESIVPESRRRILRGFDASREILDHTEPGEFALIHFSTHALIDDRIPESSKIVLSMFDREGRLVNGVLRPDQLAHLHLNGSIMVLSACNTALGKQVLGEGLAGLTSSLLYAGGSQLVLTLSEVDAEASSEFFSKAYREFLANSKSMEHSMTLARRAMARCHRFSDPYYWASFIVVGRPADKVDATE